jgi:hypothetical protein
MDSFNFGKPTRSRAQLGARTLVLVGAVIAALLVILVAFLQFASSGGAAVASAQVTTAQQVNTAEDLQAKANARTAEGAASAAYQSSGGFSTVGPQQLSILDPTLTYTTGPSTGVSVVSVASTPAAWAAAVLGPSGTCYWVKLDVITVPHYGTGSTCTGAAAMAASRSNW